MAVLRRSLPVVFVLIWATGFLVARLVAPHAEPLSFLTLRCAATCAIFTLVAVAVGAPWPGGVRDWGNALVAGVLMQGVYLGGVFWGTRHGVPAGIAALVSGLQPLLTALLALPVLGERLRPLQWVGIALGFVGVVLVILPRLGVAGTAPLAPLAACGASVVAMTLGTIWQKRTASGADLRTNAAIQFLGALLLLGPLALATEDFAFDNTPEVWIGLLWSVLGLSVGAISLLLVLIRRGAVAGVASLFYLVPPVVAVIAYGLFDERLTPPQMIGMALAAAGVALTNRTPR